MDTAFKALDHLTALTLVPDRWSRALLRETFTTVAYKGELIGAHTAANALSLLQCNPRIEIVFIEFSLGQEAVQQFIADLNAQGMGQKFGLVTTVGKSGPQLTSRLIDMYLKGIDGFIVEPYSSDDLRCLLLRVIERVRTTRLEMHTRAIKAIDLLVQEATNCLDQVAQQIANGTPRSVHLNRELKNRNSALRPLQAEYPEDYVSILLQVLDTHQAFNPRAEPERRARDRLQHPGEAISAIMQRRGITAEKALSVIRLAAEDFDRLLRCELMVTEELARDLSRTFGRTAKEWLTMQKRWEDRSANRKEGE